MLTAETKRRINSARDILVGQLPLPTDQVELITIALIYKFMDDIDEESRSIGGKATFFTGDLRDLSWRHIISNTLSADARVIKLTQGIEAISDPKNTQIPELFKSIFRNAFLKFRDGRTLKLFLDEINGFTYDHSEELGNAFEFILESMGVQADNGQFRTPRHIIEFIVDVVDPQKDETILDPACGTAGFLISAYKHIVAANTSAIAAEKNPHAGDLLKGNQRDKLTRNVVGYDITPIMCRLSRVNMYLHHFSNPVIHEYDTLTNKNRWDEKFDVILANPPFMTPKGGIKPHDRFAIAAKRTELLFVDYIAEHLNPNGRAGVIVPEGIIERNDAAYLKLRELLLRDHLIGVISLPAGLFLPYTKVKTSILVFDRAAARKDLPILFSQINDSGISLDSARTAVLQNDLPVIINDYQAMRKGTTLSALSWLVDRKKLMDRGNTLIGHHFRPKNSNGKFAMVQLGELCSITKGNSSSTKTEPGSYPLVVRGEEMLSSKSYQFEGDAVCVPLLSLAHGRGQIKRVHFVSGQFAVANLLAVLQPLNKQKLDAKYLYLALDKAKDDLAKHMQGSVFVTLKISDLANYEIPLPPIRIQKKLASEYDELHSLIAKNREMTTRMEQKIQSKLSEIWGDSFV